MSNLFKRFETSASLTSQGAPLRLPANDDGTIPTFFIARSHTANQLYSKTVAEVYTPEVSARIPDMSEAEAQELEREVFVKANLIAWENIYDRDDSPLEFNAENALDLFTQLPELFDICRRFSASMSNYLKTAEEKAVKN